MVALASGPWTEARMHHATPRVVAVRHWLEYVALLKDSATRDLDAIAEQIGDGRRMLGARSKAQQDSIHRAQLSRAAKQLAGARIHRAEIRAALHLDDEEPDGEP
jgi:hypothetical protein